MKPIFVPCSYPIYEDTRNQTTQENPPVNVVLVHGLRKPIQSHAGMYAMHFVGTNIYWNFNVEKKRDEEFMRILNMFRYVEPEEVYDFPPPAENLTGYDHTRP